ncbi:hypothetical protein PFICI_02424 [Pestalotiopsis fici W106-1]|uniref:Protein kinase domain-containing protein n=1 Tax=Pestalotiopsis fici (strain W106-1 / CGMCC3.15140) TaxID=1229662 RepID=W3XEF3_PESFW|nr:uncharacterized protein PFICI_02424 [Pestalotiopsis fici W106-1]ETS84399.1 hypothetical protein PFICI_02424 [Pestalotiopsis fici W106-1]
MELPPIPGPKLGPFQSPNGNAGRLEIEFLNELGTGAHSIVWKVKIDGTLFALKLFKRGKYYNHLDWYERPHDEDMEKLNLDHDKLNFQCLPFFSECRAYGRLKETKNEHLAAKCYGYLVLDRSYSKRIRNAGITKRDLIEWQFWAQWEDDHDEHLPLPDDKDEKSLRDWFNNVMESDEPPLPTPYPVKAIVKELVEKKTTFLPEHVSRMMRDLQQLHRLGIIHGDIKEDAYVNGLIVDFSSARTVPHFLLDKKTVFRSIEWVKSYTRSDYSCFDEQLEEYDMIPGRPKICTRMLQGKVRYNLRDRPDSEEMKLRCIKFYADRYRWKPARGDIMGLRQIQDWSAAWIRGLVDEGEWEDSEEEPEEDDWYGGREWMTRTELLYKPSFWRQFDG